MRSRGLMQPNFFQPWLVLISLAVTLAALLLLSIPVLAHGEAQPPFASAHTGEAAGWRADANDESVWGGLDAHSEMTSQWAGLGHHSGQRLLIDPITVTMVVVPSGDARQTARAAEHVASLLGEETGYHVHAFVAGCYGAAVDTLAIGEADVGWLPATTYVLAHDRFGVEVQLVTQRSGRTSYRGQFLVRSDSDINDLSQLAGKNFAFVDPLSASGFLYPALYISNTQGITYTNFFSQTVFAGSHPAVVTAVYTGQHHGIPIHGGATYEDARGSVVDQYPDVFSKVKVLTYTMSIPNDTVSTRAGLEPTTRQEVIRGLLQVASTSAGREALQQLYSIDGLQPTTDRAYDVVRQAVAAFQLQYETCSQSTTVTPNLGGTLTYTDSRGLTTTIQIPTGGLTVTAQLSYTPIPAVTHRPGNLVEIGHAFELRGVISGTSQPLTQLESPMTVTIAYAQSDLGLTTDETTLALYYWDGSQWMKEPGSVVDTAANTVTAHPNHFSRWAVLGETRRVYLPLVQRNQVRAVSSYQLWRSAR